MTGRRPLTRASGVTRELPDADTLLVPPGTVSAPGYSFSGYATCGFYAGANFFAAGVNGTEIVRYTPGGMLVIANQTVISSQQDAVTVARAAGAGLTAVGFRGDMGNGYGASFCGYVEQSVGGGAIIYTGNGSTFVEALRIDQARAVRPGGDSAQNLGTAALRWANIYLVNNPTVSSDQSLKTTRIPSAGGPTPTSAELKAWGSVSARVWTLKADARGLLHNGYIAQEVAAAFAAQGLDITRYALWQQDTMPDGSKRAALVYAECACLEDAYLRSQIAALSRQITALASALNVTLPST